MREINESLLNRYLPKKKKLKRKILDAGCGPGTALHFLSQFGDVIGVDISDEALKFAKKRGKVTKGDITALPFADETFDIVTCFDVLYHEWVNTSKAFSEIKRVLKKGGIVLMREPAYDWFRSSEDIASKTKHRFTAGEIKNMFEKSFDVLKISYINFFLFPVAFIKRLPEVLNIKKKHGVSDAADISPLIDKFLYKIFHVEPLILQYVNFPFGTSVICIAKKR